MDDLEALRQLVRQYRIHWTSSPEYAVDRDALHPIGFNVELSATHGQVAHPPSPGCPECLPVMRALDTISEFVLPKGERASFYEVRINGAHEFPRGARGEPEMTSLVTILHRGDPNLPPDECEKRCRDEILSKLRLLGAREGAWRGSPGDALAR